MNLNDIRDRPGARRKKKCLGRGIGSGLGKTSGRGGKGQTARTGVAIRAFEGGQTPLYRRLPKRGFVRPNRPEFVELNLGLLQEALEGKRLSASEVITADKLREVGLIKRCRDGIRLLGEGEITHKVRIEVVGASARAKAAIEALGGECILVS